MPEGTNGNITYTTKELLTRIEAKLDSVAGRLDQKADLAAVTGLDSRLGILERKGSDQAQEALQGLHELQREVDRISQETAVAKANRRLLYALLIPIAVNLVSTIFTILRELPT